MKWFSKPVLREPGGAESEAQPARNVLPPKFASPKSSGVTVRIQEGENKLPAIVLKRY